MRSRIVLLALLVVAGGCLGGTPSDDNTAPPTTSALAQTTSTTTLTQTTTVPTTSYYDCPYDLYLETVTREEAEHADRFVAYENLTEARQGEFDRLLESDTVALETLPDQWSAPTVVEHDGEHYEVVAATC